MIEVMCDNESCTYNAEGCCDRGKELTVKIVEGVCMDVETDAYTKMD